MGLYDDDLDAARQSGVFAEARRRCGTLKSLDDLASALGSLDALATAFPAIEGSDEEYRGLRSACQAAGRELRARAGFAGFAKAHGAFAESLDVPHGFRKWGPDPRLRYSFWYPGAWFLEEGAGMVRVQPEPEGRDYFMVIAKALPEVPALERFAAWKLEKLREELPGCNIPERGFRSLDGMDAYEVRFAAANVRGWQMYALDRNVGFTLALLTERLAELEPAARAIAGSFRWNRKEK